MAIKNQTILITGASSGIGEACARYFAKQGAQLILCARRNERLQDMAKQFLEEYQTKCLVLTLDVTNKEAVQSQLVALPQDFATIDVLINNAGLAAGLDKLQDGVTTDWDDMIDTNIKGVLYLTRQILPNMVARNEGHIINVSSIAAHEIYTKGGVYCATKHAVDAITRTLRLDLLGTKIRVSAISPGLVETEFSLVRFKGDSQKAKEPYKGMQPLLPDDVADAVGYCVACPPHVNISEIIIMPTAQAAATSVFRG